MVSRAGRLVLHCMLHAVLVVLCTCTWSEDFKTKKGQGCRQGQGCPPVHSAVGRNGEGPRIKEGPASNS